MPARVVLALLAGASACTTPPSGLRPAVDEWQARSAPARAAVRPARDAARAAADGAGDFVREDADETAPPADLAELLAWAEAHSPGLQAAAQHWKAALERVSQAGALPDPRLTFGYYLEEVQTRTGPMQWRVGLSQTLPWFGELDLADEAALADARAAGARFEAERLALRGRVRDAWAELAWAAAAARVTQGHLALLSNWEQVAHTRYATGQGAEADVIRAQIELGTLEDRARSLEDLRRPLSARVNAALDRPRDAALPTPGIDQQPRQLDEAQLRERLALANPRLADLGERVRAAESRVELARTDAWPDAALGVDFTRIGKGGQDAVALTGGISLPLRRGHIDSRIAQAEAELGAARAEQRELGNRLAAELEQRLYEWRDAERRLTLYRDTLLPKGHESVQAIGAAYQSGETGFLDLIDAERVLLEFELAVARAGADREQALAAIETLAGPTPAVETGP